MAGQKTNDNPENTVGILTLAGKGPRVLVTPTSDLGKILGAMHDLGMEGETNICTGVQVRTVIPKILYPKFLYLEDRFSKISEFFSAYTAGRSTDPSVVTKQNTCGLKLYITDFVSVVFTLKSHTTLISAAPFQLFWM